MCISGQVSRAFDTKTKKLSYLIYDAETKSNCPLTAAPGVPVANVAALHGVTIRVRVRIWHAYITPKPHFSFQIHQIPNKNHNLKLLKSSEADCVCSLKMASYEKPTDEYGTPVGSQVDEYGNPLGHHTTTTGTTTGAGGYAPHDLAATTAAGQGLYGHDYDKKEHHGVLHRSGSSSSSSSEDDGLGGRRKKKGLKEKIKEKLPGGTKTETTYGGTGTTGQHHEEKGMMDKIKEKLPGTGGHRADDPYSSQPHTAATATPYGGTAYTEEHHEKKGIVDKIKEKLPGQH